MPAGVVTSSLGQLFAGTSPQGLTHRNNYSCEEKPARKYLQRRRGVEREQLLHLSAPRGIIMIHLVGVVRSLHGRRKMLRRMCKIVY
jgi:hypothetical protein